MPVLWINQSLGKLWAALSQREKGRGCRIQILLLYLWPDSQRVWVFEDSTEVNQVEGASPKWNLHIYVCSWLEGKERKPKLGKYRQGKSLRHERSLSCVKLNTCGLLLGISRDQRDSLFLWVENVMGVLDQNGLLSWTKVNARDTVWQLGPHSVYMTSASLRVAGTT